MTKLTTEQRIDALDRITRIDNFKKELSEIRARVEFLESKHPLYMYEEGKGWQVGHPVDTTPRVDTPSFIPNHKPVLENARALIERGWTQCELAIDPSGVSCDPCNPSAFAWTCLLYTSPSPRDRQKSRMPSSA